VLQIEIKDEKWCGSKNYTHCKINGRKKQALICGSKMRRQGLVNIWSW